VSAFTTSSLAYCPHCDNRPVNADGQRCAICRVHCGRIVPPDRRAPDATWFAKRPWRARFDRQPRERAEDWLVNPSFRATSWNGPNPQPAASAAENESNDHE